MVQAPWINPGSEVLRVARKYRVPVHVLASIKAKNPEVIAKAYLAAHSREYYDLMSTASERLTFLGRPVSFKAERVKIDGNPYARITLRFPTTAVVWLLPMNEFQKLSPEEWMKRLTDWVLVKARLVEVESKQRKQRLRYWAAEKVVFAKVEEDAETFRHLVNSYAKVTSMPVITAVCSLLGYATKACLESPELQFMTVLYALPVTAAEPIHGLLLTRPGLGKTTVALLYRDVLKWEYFNEVPSPATLVGDARTGRSRVAGATGLWFDEIDKWSLRKSKLDDFIEVVEIILTGLEQGYWRRSKGGEKAIETHNEIPAMFTGNIAMANNPREIIRGIIARASQDAAKAFEERIGYAVTITADWQHIIMSSTWEARARRRLIAKPSVLRGMRTVLQEWYLAQPEPVEIPKDIKGRYARAYKRIYRALRVLLSRDGLSVKEDIEESIARLAEKLVRGLVITRGLEDLTTTA